MLDKIKQSVSELLKNERSGHGMEHINRVLALSQKIAAAENADSELVTLIALLHDVDDRKLFKNNTSEPFPHAKKIMQNADVDMSLQEQVLEELNRIGYHKRLDGIAPSSIEGKIVSDADMCDALGASGITRTCAYSAAHHLPFFDRNTFPRDSITTDDYVNGTESSSVNHLFEKCLKLNSLMLTKPGRKLADKRRQVTINFLYDFFSEENAPEWIAYLDNFLANEK